jgi:hypothetical protein
MLINNKHITPFFSSTYSSPSFFSKNFKNEKFFIKGSLKGKLNYNKTKTTVVLLHTYGKNVNKVNLFNSKENFLFNKESQFLGNLDKKPSLIVDKGVLDIKNKNPYNTIPNQKVNKTLLELHKFLKQSFFPVSSYLGATAIKKDKFKNHSFPLPLFYSSPGTGEDYSPFYKKLLKGFIGKELNAHNQNLIHSKSITYSFKNHNNINSLLSSTKLIDMFLKKFFLSIGTLISKPTYLNRQDKIIIRLFVYFSPKINNFLKTSLLNQSS